MSKALNMHWSAKILKTKNFVVLTDTESVINLEGKNLDVLEDRMVIAAQAASLSAFYERLGKLIKEHDAVLEGKTTKKKAKAKSKR